MFLVNLPLWVRLLAASIEVMLKVADFLVKPLARITPERKIDSFDKEYREGLFYTTMTALIVSGTVAYNTPDRSEEFWAATFAVVLMTCLVVPPVAVLVRQGLYCIKRFHEWMRQDEAPAS